MKIDMNLKALMMKTDVSTPTSLNEISLDLKFMD
jgi:hypothetical protein